MAFKTTLAAALAVFTLALAPAPQAEAKTNVHIGIGIGGGYGDPCYGPYGYRCGWRPRPHYFYYVPRHRPAYFYDDYYNYRPYRPYRPVGRLSCRAARNMVDHSGFNAVQARDCSGRIYSFRARKNGHNYIVKVNAVSGRIIGVGRY